MSAVLSIVKAKPNPFGKDKVSGTPLPEQLLGEWVDIQNKGNESVVFSSMELRHTMFDSKCNNLNRTEVYWNGGGVTTLTPGQTIRVHTGRLSDKDKMNPADDGAVAWHGYANRDNFVLNNKCGDIIRVTWSDSSGKRWYDEASYDANQPEGAILHRSGNKLVLASGRGW